MEFDNILEVRKYDLIIDYLLFCESFYGLDKQELQSLYISNYDMLQKAAKEVARKKV